jgi:hypothetical protein
MNDRNLLRGLFLAAVSLAFGLGALRYPLGELSRAGPGLFPLLISSLLFVIAVITIVRSRFVEALPLNFNWKNIALIMLALCGFAVISKLLDMAAGIVFMVFVGSLAGITYSWVRNLKISAGLIGVAFGFQHLLGLNLPLF